MFLVIQEMVSRQLTDNTVNQRILETVQRQNWRQLTDRFEDSSPTKVINMCLYLEKKNKKNKKKKHI